MTTTEQIRGRAVAQAGFVFGSLTSIAANVLHTYLPTVHMPEGLLLGLAARLGAAIWPIGLLLSIEVLARVSWRRGPAWRIARFGGAGTVAMGSAIISYGHVREVLLAWGYGHPAAEFGPLTLDGLMVVCGFALLSMTPHGEQAAPGRVRQLPERAEERRPSPNHRLAHEVSLATQVEHLAPVTLPHANTVDTASGHDTDADVVQVDTANVPKDSTVEEVDTGADMRRERAQELHAQGWTHRQIATELGVSKRTVQRYLSTGADTEPDDSVTSDMTVDTDPAAITSKEPVTDWLSTLGTTHPSTNGVHA